ncbi:MAG: hypothetical protein JWO41_31 [Candidatus Saccharibacteria bacterium]|nr:hypothetical protein [Candidatus Saccharibacteria bacterium]
MSETLEKQPQLEAQNYSPEEIQALLAAGMLDPALYPEYSQAADPSLQPNYDPSNPYASVETGQIVPESLEVQTQQAAQEAATKRLAEIEAAELKRAAEVPNTTAAAAVELTLHNAAVIEAEKAVHEAISGSDTQAKEEAIREAIAQSPIEGDTAEVARAAAEGRSPTKLAEQAAPEPEAVEGYSELKAKPNANADKLLSKFAKRVGHPLEAMGVKPGRNKLKAQIAEAGGADLTKAEVAHDVEQQIVGMDFLKSFADNKARGNRAKRTEAIKALRETGSLRIASEAMGRMRRGGTVSAGTERRIGKRLMRAFSKH